MINYSFDRNKARLAMVFVFVWCLRCLIFFRKNLWVQFSTTVHVCTTYVIIVLEFYYTCCTKLIHSTQIDKYVLLVKIGWQSSCFLAYSLLIPCFHLPLYCNPSDWFIHSINSIKYFWKNILYVVIVMNNKILFLLSLISFSGAFSPNGLSSLRPSASKLFMGEEDENKAAPLVSGEDLEVMLTEWDQPLVIDAYATW